MVKVVSSVPKQRFERFGVRFPEQWETVYIPYPYTDEQLIEALSGATFLFVMSVHPVSARVIESSAHLKLIHVEGVGYDKVDLDASKRLGIPVCNNRAVNDGAVAEHTIGLMLAGLRRTALCDAQIKSDGFSACQKEFFAAGQRELSGMRVGLIGMGAIGREVARRLKGWGCAVFYYDAFRPSPEVERSLDISYLGQDELLSSCEIISLHVPVLPSTRNLLSEREFDIMLPSALVINTARGEIIDHQALANALEKGRIYGAALDTVYPEPPPPDHPLLTLSPQGSRRLIITPHAGGTTNEAFTRMLTRAVANMQRVLDGEAPSNIVNGAAAGQ